MPAMPSIRSHRATLPAVVLALGLAAPGALDPLAACAAPVAYAPAESAAVARRAWGQARAARAEKRHDEALALASRAHAAWPGQWAYAYGLASIAALARDGATCARGLGDLAALGAGPDLARDTTLVTFARSAAGRAAGADAALARVEANAVSRPRSQVALVCPAADSALWPEGIAFDPATGRTFIAGVRDGRVVVFGSGKFRDFVRAGVDVPWSALAVAVDAPRGLLWVTTAAMPQHARYAIADSGRAALLAFDLASGAPRARHDLPATAEGHVPGDVCVAADGDVYVSDSVHPAIWRLRDGTVTAWATDPGFRSLQGQALSADQKTLFVADYSHGLAAIDRASARVTWLPGPSNGGSALGIDGLVAWEDDLVAVQNGIVPPRVVRIELVRDGTGAPVAVRAVREVDRNLEFADEPTLLARQGDGGLIYVANSQWEKYGEDGVRRPGARLEPPRLLRLEPEALR